MNDLQYRYTQLYGPADYVPLMVVTYWTFRIMMLTGFVMIGLCAVFLVAARKPLEKYNWMKWVPWLIALPYIANACGWILTEMGRQPWIVQGLLRVDQAISPNLTTLDIAISLAGFAMLYGALAVVNFSLMKKYAIAGIKAALQESVELGSVTGGADD